MSGSGKPTRNVCLPMATYNRLARLRIIEREPLYGALDRLLDEHDARSRAATPTTPREEAAA